MSLGGAEAVLTPQLEPRLVVTPSSVPSGGTEAPAADSLHVLRIEVSLRHGVFCCRHAVDVRQDSVEVLHNALGHILVVERTPCVLIIFKAWRSTTLLKKFACRLFLAMP